MASRTRYFYPLGKRGPIIGRPYAGTHRLGNWQSDNAIDISVPVGTPVYAVDAGTISKITPHPQDGGRFAGDQVTLSGARDSFFYTHLSRFVVKAGQRVKRGALIGYSGAANGVAHLHFGERTGSPLRLVGAPISSGATGGTDDQGLGVFDSTSYGPPWGGIQGGGVTANGTNLRDSPKVYGVAVDPTVIPLGSKLFIHPNPFNHPGTFTAFDTGGAIKGKRIDFYDWRGRGHQNGWGRRKVHVSLTTGAQASEPSFSRSRPGGDTPDDSQVDTVLAGYWDHIPGPLGLVPDLPNPLDLFKGASKAINGTADFFKWIAWIFHPLNILRAVEVQVGLPMIGFGLWILVQEWKGADSQAPFRLVGDVASMTPVGRGVRVVKGVRSGRKVGRSSVRRQQTRKAMDRGRKSVEKRQGEKDLRAGAKRDKRKGEEIPF